MLNNYIQNFDNKKQKVLSFLEDSIAILENGGQSDESSSLQVIKNDLEKMLFSIVLVGEFSAGKSTFLNALMHKKYLPSFTGETTATVNYLRHKEEAPNGEPGIVYYNNGDRKVLPDLTKDTIEEYVSTRSSTLGSTGVAKNVQKVELFLESEFLKNGVMLVDTPGLNGIAENHTEITEKEIKSSYASIFLFNADRPGSKSDFATLHSLRQNSKRIFFVLNKIDVIREEESDSVDKVIGSLKESYKKEFPEATIPKIWPISARNALLARDKNLYQDSTIELDYESLEDKSLMQAFENRLWKYLTEGERAKEQLTTPIEQTLGFLKDYLKLAEEQLDVLENDDVSQKYEERKNSLEEEIKRLKYSKDVATGDVKSEFNSLLRDVKESCSAKLEKISLGTKKELMSIDDEDDLQSYIKTIDRKINSFCLSVTNELDDSFGDTVRELIKEKCFDYFTKIEEHFSENNLGSFSVPKIKFECSEFIVKSNLKKFEEEQERIIQEMDKLRSEISKKNKEHAEAVRQERRLHELNKELSEQKAYKNSIIEHFPISEIVYGEHKEIYKRDREGFLGGIAQFLVGQKRDERYVKYEDDRAYKASVERQKEYLEGAEESINNIKDQINTQRAQMLDSIGISIEIDDYKQQLETLSQEKQKKLAEFENGLKKQHEKAIRKLRNEIEDYIDEKIDSVRALLTKYINGEVKKKYLQPIEAIITNSIVAELENKLKEQEQLEKNALLEGTERKNRLDNLKTIQENIKLLMNRGLEINALLEEEMKDIIEEV